ncbi:hypothetical protein [Streptomyces sp. NPDC090026]|uniref:hypothetical protein n=1 Tax=Streptomyces sp. NPDC090026 TaxID=3365923 RepID=UPI003823E53A
MGYELYREVKVWAPDGLTHREKLTALVLADDAHERTRLTWKSVVDPEIMRQAMVKNDRDMRKIIAALQAVKVLEHAGGGHNGRTAKYRFAHLAPEGCPGPPCECPLALPVQNAPATHVGGSESTGYEEAPDTETCQNEPATDDVAGPNRHRSRSESDRPTPSTSSTTTSSTTKSAGRPASRATTAPEHIHLDERMYAWAAERSLTRDRVDRETEKFLDYHRAKGTKNRDWNAAWRNWMRKAVEFGASPSARRSSGHTPYQAPTDRSVYQNGF